jgi:hypothetical protein
MPDRLVELGSASRIVESSLRRRWLFLLPAVFVTYSLAYLDRANFGFGAAAGLATTLHITSEQSFRLPVSSSRVILSSSFLEPSLPASTVRSA